MTIKVYLKAFQSYTLSIALLSNSILKATKSAFQSHNFVSYTQEALRPLALEPVNKEHCVAYMGK